MRITKFLRFSNYIQLKNGRLISRPMPPIATTTTNNNKEKDTQKEKDKQKEKNKNKEGFPWE